MTLFRWRDEVAFWGVKFFASMIAGMVVAFALASVLSVSLARDIGFALSIGLVTTVKPSWRRTRSRPRQMLAAVAFGTVFFLMGKLFEYAGWFPRNL